MHVPNNTHHSVPIGKEEACAELVGTYNIKPNECPFDHSVIAQDFDLLDFERAGKVSGSGFYYLKNMGALYEMVIISFSNLIMYRPYVGTQWTFI